MKKILPIILLLLLSAPMALFSRGDFDHRALLWWTPKKEIILLIDYYTTRAVFLMQRDRKKIKGNQVTLEHDLISLVGLKQVQLPLQTYTRKKHQGLIRIGTIQSSKKEEILLQNGINFKQGQQDKKSNGSPYKNFGVPGF